MKNYFKITALSMLLIAFLQSSFAQDSTTIGGNTLPVQIGDASNASQYVSSYSMAGVFVLSTGSVSILNNSTYEHGNTLLDNNGTWNSTTGSNDLFGASGTNTISGSNAPGFYNTNFNIGTSNVMAITNSQGINIYGTLAFNNGITTTVRSNNQTGAVRFQSGATYTGDTTNTKYVNGYVSNVGNASFTFPVGNQNNIEERTLSVSSMNTSNHLSVAYWAGDVGTALDPTGGAHSRSNLGPGLQQVSSIGFWDWIAVTGSASVNISVKIPDMTTSGFVSIRLVGWNISNSRWELIGAAGPTSNTAGGVLTGSVTDISAYSAIGMGDIYNALPVSLTSFDVVKQDNDAYLTWVTASEFNTDKYEIQRSGEQMQFEKIGEVKAAGNSNSVINYHFTDSQVGLDFPNQNLYYRLKQLDKDGKFTYSSIRLVKFDQDNNPTAVDMRVFPNPANDFINLETDVSQVGVTYNIMDLSGNRVLTGELTSSKTQVDISQLFSGIYFLQTGEKGKTVKIVKQ